MWTGRFTYPPRNAKGIESRANGQKRGHRKNPALQNCQELKQATKTFRINAVGFTSSGMNPKRVITAMYPEAPAWPTEEYRKATSNIARQTRRRCSIEVLVAL
jgi:hypothetical protein